MTNDFSSRLKEARVARGLSQTALADVADLAPGQINRYEAGKNSPRAHVLHKLAGALGVFPQWLQTGEGPRDSGKSTAYSPHLDVTLSKTKNGGNLELGLSDELFEYLQQKAKEDGLTIDEYLREAIFAPFRHKSELQKNRPGLVPLVSWIEAAETSTYQTAEEYLECPVPHSNKTFALRVRGDSMTAPSGASRTYPADSIIFVDPCVPPSSGDRVIAVLESLGEVTFKTYINEDGKQWLMPLNPLYEPIREPFRVRGTVIGKWEPE